MFRLLTALLLVAVVSAEIPEFGEIPLEDEIDDESERIIGGQQAKQGQFPYTAALYMDEEFICTASIISVTSILTAAHCVVFNGVQQPASSFNAIIGNVNRSSSDSKQIFFRKVTAHPQYDNLENDLAILETATPIQFTDRIQPICIADSNFPNLILKSVTAMGWGQDSRDDRKSPDILRYVQQRVVSNLKCRILYLGRKVPESSLCASGILSGVCYGDSGGPLVYEKGRNGQKIQIGIASYVNSIVGCGSKLGPAGFTRVSYFTDYIMNTATGKVCVV
ncbi:unnamed protein product [Larinioides sclopetarius]|uniref:Peptidase S1 domain-containing protein n=1 Tax=Larinioides sclopetarius TaxID=280406 RepID=A0AAV2AU34_9ARAC